MGIYIGPAAVCFSPIKSKRKVQEITYTCTRNKCFEGKRLSASKFCNNCGGAVEVATTVVEIDDFPRTMVIAAAMRNLSEIACNVADAQENTAYCTFGRWPFNECGVFVNDLPLHLEEFKRKYEADIEKLRTYFANVVVANIIANIKEDS